MRCVIESRQTQLLNQYGWRRQVRDTFWKVVVRGSVREQAANPRNYLPEIDSISETNKGICWHANIQQRDSAALPSHASDFGKECWKVKKIAQRKTTSDTIDARVWEGQAKYVGLCAGCVAVICGEHAE